MIWLHQIGRYEWFDRDIFIFPIIGYWFCSLLLYSSSII